ncbi:MAG: peptide-methionine (R)-S-oxide reductase MsrB [Chitinophagales bacterium]
MKNLLLILSIFVFASCHAQDFEIEKTDDQWKEELSDEQFDVLCGGATEAPFTGEYLYNKEEGSYNCAACDNPLFSSDTKYDSGSGWPSFYEQVDKEAIKEIDDYSYGMKRTEIVCAQCGGHLGHVFDDGPSDKTGMRYCVNSVSLQFESKTDSTANEE